MFYRLYITGGKNMKLYSSRILLTCGWLLMTTPPIMASVSYSTEQCDQLAMAIVNGNRPPLSEQELANLAPETVNQLTRSLISAREAQKKQSVIQLPTPIGGNERVRAQVPASSQSEPSGPVERLPLTKNQQEFIDLISHDAQQIANDNDLFASVLMAQAILESNWGHSDLAHYHNNLFGIKGSYRGQSVAMPTGEHIQGQDVQVQANFRKYPRIEEALLDYANILNQKIYEGAHKRHCASYQEATKALNNVYATDPNYHQKLNRLIENYDLTKYDHPVTSSKQTKQRHQQPIHQKLLDNKEPVLSDHQQTNEKKKGFVVPLLGGIGSMSLIEIIKRYVK